MGTSRRPAARVVCLDRDGRVLLMHWYDPISGTDVWEPPGGGLDPGETPLEAARRELAEEERAAYRGYVWAERLPDGVEPPELAEVVEKLRATGPR